MVRFNLYDAETNKYESFLIFTSPESNRFNIYNSKSNEYIAYGNFLDNDRVIVYDAKDNKPMYNGNVSKDRIDLYNPTTGIRKMYGLAI